MKKLYLLLALFSMGFLFSQNTITIDAEFLNISPTSYLKLHEFSSDKIIAEADFKDSKAIIKTNVTPGVYQLLFQIEGNEERYMELIVTGKESTISAFFDAKNSTTPLFKDSPVNQSYYQYRQNLRMHEVRTGIFIQVLAFYPGKEEDVYAYIKKDLAKKKKDFQDYREKLITEYKGMILDKYLRYQSVWYPPVIQDEREKKLSQISAFWDNKPTSIDKNMINTPLYKAYVLEYIELFAKSYNIEEGTKAMKKGIDTIMSFYGKNPDVKRQVVRALIGYFYGNEPLSEILKYLDQTYVDATLVEGQQLQEYAFRLASYRSLQKGKPVYPIHFKDENNKLINLRDIQAKTTIVVFWESTCTHCRKQMPILNSYVKGKTDIKVLAVSLDENKVGYNQFAKILDAMYHYCDFKGMESSIVKNYYIQSTPTFFVLDNQKNLLEKTSSVDQLKYFLEKR